MIFGVSFSNRKARKATASIEGIVADARHAARDCYACKSSAKSEGTIADARHAVRNGDAGQVAATVEREVADARDLLSVVDRRDFDAGVGAGSDSGNGAGPISVGFELQTFRAFVRGGSGGEDSGVFHGVIPFWVFLCNPRWVSWKFP